MSTRSSDSPVPVHGRVILFQEQAIRRSWQDREWWFSVVDVCAVLTGSVDAGAYWRKLKQRLIAESGQPVTFCHGLKLKASDARATFDGDGA
jgi:DNA-damage-inducible protein D